MEAAADELVPDEGMEAAVAEAVSDEGAESAEFVSDEGVEAAVDEGAEWPGGSGRIEPAELEAFASEAAVENLENLEGMDPSITEEQAARSSVEPAPE
jgi:hypothetical protein